MLDRSSLPTAAAYVEGLPHGLRSYPDCEARSDFVEMLLQEFPDPLRHPGVSEEARRLLLPVPGVGWMPDVTIVAMRLLARDVVFKDDAAFLKWSFESALKVFAKPTYRMLMFVLSPTLVLMGATKRWGTFRRGTELAAEIAKGQASLKLTYPQGLYPAIMLQSIGEMFRAALVGAKAGDVSVRVTKAGDTATTFEVRWS